MTADELFPLPPGIEPPKPSRSPYGSLYERLVANTVLAVEDNPQSCWLWTGKVKPGRDPYPHINVWRDGKHCTLKAHRVMLEIVLGRPLAPEEEGDHLCHVMPCIHPDHLRPATQVENLSNRRGYAPVRSGI